MTGFPSHLYTSSATQGLYGSGLCLPFTSIVGREEVKKALLLVAIDPGIGGVLLSGSKGTAKTTLARALANLLPPIEVVEDCPFNCHPRDPRIMCQRCRKLYFSGRDLPSKYIPTPFVEIPLNTTEEMLIGGLDFERTIKTGKNHFMPGIFARANRGIVYIDEVNLLPDGLVDLILQVATSGVNTVKREGVDVSHPSLISLIGSMNPEEGELRPHFLDRFGLFVRIEDEKDVQKRVEIIKRVEEFAVDPKGFQAKWLKEEEALRKKIEKAREILPYVSVPKRMEIFMEEVCLEYGVEGHRGDIVLRRASKAHAALFGRDEVTFEDIEATVPLALSHRRRIHGGERRKEKHRDIDLPRIKEALKNGLKDRIFPTGDPFRVKDISLRRDRILRTGSGRRDRSKVATKSGKYVKVSFKPFGSDIALDASIRAAAPYQIFREKKGVAISLKPEDLRGKIRERRVGSFLVFTVDASGSMGAMDRMIQAKGAVLSLLLDAYQKRDRISMVAFRGEKAYTLLPPTSSIELAAKRLEDLPTGGKTPLIHGLVKAYSIARSYLVKDKNIKPKILVISDGKLNVPFTEKGRPIDDLLAVSLKLSKDRRIHWIFIDAEDEPFGLNLLKRLARVFKGDYYRIPQLKAGDIVDILRRTG